MTDQAAMPAESGPPTSGAGAMPGAWPNGQSGSWSGALLWGLLWGLAMAAFGAVYLRVPPSPDQTLFDYIGWIATQGGSYYADAFEMNWPGKMLIHETGLRLFGTVPWSFRAIDFLLHVLLCLAVARLLLAEGLRRAALVFLFLYPAFYISAGVWMAGQRDIVAAGVLLAAAAAAQPVRRLEGAGMLLAGVLVAAAVLIRPTYLAFLAGLCILEWLPVAPRGRRLSARTRCALVLAGFAATVAVVLVLGAMAGNLDDWYAQSLVFSTSVYQVPLSRARLTEDLWHALSTAWHWLGGLALLGTLAWIWASVRQARASYALAAVWGMIATVILSYFVQNKGFGYHLGGLLLAFSVLIAVLIDRLSLAARWRGAGLWPRAAMVMLVAAAALTLAGTLKKLSHVAPHALRAVTGPPGPLRLSPLRLSETQLAEIVTLITEGSPPGAPMIQFGGHYEVPVLAGRPPSSPLINVQALNLVRADQAGGEAWVEAFRADLAANPPAFVLLERYGIIGEDQPLRLTEEVRPELARAHLVEEVLPGYRIVHTTPLTFLLKRDPDSGQQTREDPQ